ncbi:tetratricopeptide repeat protein [Aestuariivirga sp.]|uniref:tetratricopeptide repeat protein n=1 Tax=Aestuariivirga sp. TaxID=2650926 RepID=UPI0039E6FC9E
MHKLVTFSLAAFCLASATALAAGGGGSGGGSSSSGGGGSPQDHDCKKGEVWNKKTKKCMKQQSGVLPDEDLYQQGRALAKEGQYDWALEVLALVQNQNDPRVLNYMGYSNRKAGRLEVGISYYRKALAINPNFVLAREYLGEGYVAAGRNDLAKAELAEIAQRCGVTCEEYRDLSLAIAGKAE